jgi:protein-L-isoaspartate(D-aspartate) O-methyltransferase
MLAPVTIDPPRGGAKAARPHEALRRRLLAEIADEVRKTREYLGTDTLDPRVMAALAAVPRHEFVPEGSKHLAYENSPLPIGHGQTISQPYIVAVMTHLLEPRPDDAILEIGTGCGYQTAVIAELVRKVYSIEYVPELAREASERLARLGYGNVELRAGDGWFGWPEAAPFDGIIVTAAAARIPTALAAQLKPGRRMIVPIGAPREEQELSIVEGGQSGPIAARAILPVAFVPFKGG